MNNPRYQKPKIFFSEIMEKYVYVLNLLWQVLWHLSMLVQDSQRVDTVARQETVKHNYNVKGTQA
jgi:hypothetical protein